jgi:cytochrome c-type biogenesis protein CcmF
MLAVVSSAFVFVFSVESVRTTSLITIMLAVWVVVAHFLLILTSEAKVTLVPMVMAHIGFAFAATGAVINSDYSYEYHLRVEPESSHQRSDVSIDYHGIEWVIGPNYTAERASIYLHLEDGRTLSLQPEKRHYPVRVMNMTEPAIRSLWHGDYYVTLGDKVDSNAYAIKLQYRAGIWWIWSGGLIAVFGALMTLANKRKKVAHGVEEYA